MPKQQVKRIKKIKVVKSKNSKPKQRLRLTNSFKRLIKDLKRARWTNISDSRKTFVKVVVFIIVIALALYGLAVGFIALWNTIGVGPNE